MRALADVYRTAVRAQLMLRSVGYPAWAIPAGAITMGEFWDQISAELEKGVMAEGRTRILARAHAEHPFHPLFAEAAARRSEDASSLTEAGNPAGRPGARLRVMVLGAEPARYGANRAGADLREAAREARDRLDIRLFPAAGAADLAAIRSVLPHVLHLACHGTEETLILEDGNGEAHHLAADDLAGTLGLAAEHRGHRLRALVLRSCDSEPMAQLFTPHADVVIAHRGKLDAECSVLFTTALYRELATLSPTSDAQDFASAARFAAQDTVNQAAMCRSIQTGLVVLPRTP
ncbi:effector-associated domain EAD1-containing protein [Streptomyces sp. NPDC048737]|uniref:effector-associated domain EAD1-containing protein n=1 Tax=unclassified Streptomyces TaxID=2593676 RepID=UPI0034325577